MAKETLTVRIHPETWRALDAIAQSLNRDRSYVVNDALAAFVETYRWQTEHIWHGLREAEAGKFVGMKDVKRVLARLRRRRWPGSF
jgi:predicted transcriptional regulator